MTTDLQNKIDSQSIDRFWSKVNKTDSCWLWMASGSNGYGRFHFNKKSHMAHRFSLILNGVSVPKDKVVDHMCRTKNCVNPSHLRVVTQKINVLENSLSIPALNNKKTKCKRGHEFNEENTQFDIKKGRRVCRPCHNEVNRKITNYYERHINGYKNPRYKLSYIDVEYIRKNYTKPPESNATELAKKFNVSTRNIQRIIKGKIWKK